MNNVLRLSSRPLAPRFLCFFLQARDSGGGIAVGHASVLRRWTQAVVELPQPRICRLSQDPKTGLTIKDYGIRTIPRFLAKSRSGAEEAGMVNSIDYAAGWVSIPKSRGVPCYSHACAQDRTRSCPFGRR